MARYRISIDVIDRDGVAITSGDLTSIKESLSDAMKIALPPEKKRNIKVVFPEGFAGQWHAHNGDNTCTVCRSQADDGLNHDATAFFTTPV